MGKWIFEAANKWVNKNVISLVFVLFVSGKGQKLCEIERIQFFLSKKKTDELRNLHKLLYNRPGTVRT